MSRRLKISRRTALQGLAATAAIGSVRLAAAASGEPIVIGLQTELTGALSHDGGWEKRAAEAAVAWQNERGGFAGRPIKLVVVDTETKVDVGIRRLQQLLQQENCDFIIGSGHGGIGMASVPLCRDAQVTYLPLARTDGITTEFGNPYTIRMVANSTMGAAAASKWMVDSLGKRWGIILADYAFGYSQREAFTASLAKVGGELTQAIALPVNTNDPLPYLLKLDRSLSGIVMAILGPDSVRVYPALRSLGFGKTPKITVSCTQNLFDIVKLGAAVDGVYSLDEVPWELDDYPNPTLAKTAFERIGIGTNGRAKDGDDYVMLPSAIMAWEYTEFLRQAVEGAQWKTKADNLALSKWLAANPDFALSEGFPQGGFSIRAIDQQAFIDQYILQIQNGHMKRVSKAAGNTTVYPSKDLVQR
jgi:branched-chain amino acid transport system substrate-binding protein